MSKKKKEQMEDGEVALASSSILENTESLKTFCGTSFGQVDVYDPRDIQQCCENVCKWSLATRRRVTIAALCLCLGKDRVWLRAVLTGQTRDLYGRPVEEIGDECRAVLERMMAAIEMQWEEDMLSGELNPVVAFFYGKNNFGYTDTSQVKIEGTVRMAAKADKKVLEDIVAKYKEIEG